MKHALLLVLLTLLAHGVPAAASVSGNTKVIIQVDVNAGAIRVEKLEGGRRKHLDGHTLAIKKESFRAGWFKPVRVEQHFRKKKGSTYLENVVFFAGSRTIRTSRYYSEMEKAGHPVSGSVIVESDYGQILYSTVKRYGPENTWILIRK